MEFYHLDFTLHIKYWIFRFDSRRKLSTGGGCNSNPIQEGVNPYLTLPVAFAAGVLAGICTGLIHVKCKVRDLLSGIIMMTALWTMNLYIAGNGKCTVVFTAEYFLKMIL